MTLQERISADMKEAMKAKDKVRLAALRDIKSKIMLALTETGGADTLDDAAVTKILSKQLKQREDTMAIYKEQGREDLYAEEEAQADALRVYLPKPMSESELASAVEALIAGGADVGAAHPWTGQTAIHAAAYLGRSSWLSLMLSHGGEASATDPQRHIQRGDGLEQRAQTTGRAGPSSHMRVAQVRSVACLVARIACE